ncbi:MAG: class I SAM-dependent methyltransferase [Dinoroseobacter sp.]|nr:class I SAM-dependent methyltransferase [Dinoroseobacter sp.]
MPSPRLEIALAADELHWPDGPVLALRPPPQQTGLPQDRTLVVHGFKPAHDAWAKSGYAVAAETPATDFAAAYIALPRAKDHAFALLACALDRVAPGGLIAIDGAKTDGVDSVARALKELDTSIESLSKAHGRLLWFRRPENVTDAVVEWGDRSTSPQGWMTAPGVFSANAVDVGSRLLVESLAPLSGRGADLGAGWGYLSAQVLSSMNAVTHLDLVEAEWAALECARANVLDPRADFHWADATCFQAPAYDFIVMNPPFHTSRQADPALGQRFVVSAARLLKRTGRLTLVANRHLPYEETLRKSFAEVGTRAEASGFKVIQAGKPRPYAGR